MVKGLVSYVKATISKLNDLRYFGNIVVYRSDDFLGRGISWFTESEFTHCALVTGKDKAVGVRLNYWNLLPFVKRKEFKRFHNLENPLKEYTEYLILRHKKMSLLKRIAVKKIYNEMNINKYDLRLFSRKALSHGFRKTKRFLGYKNLQNLDSRDLSREGAWLCGSATIHPLSQLEKLTRSLNINWSQVEPQNILEDDDFEIVERGYRTENGGWIREKIKNKRVTKGLLFRILPSYTTPHQPELKK